MVLFSPSAISFPWRFHPVHDFKDHLSDHSQTCMPSQSFPLLQIPRLKGLINNQHEYLIHLPNTTLSCRSFPHPCSLTTSSLSPVTAILSLQFLRPKDLMSSLLPFLLPHLTPNQPRNADGSPFKIQPEFYHLLSSTRLPSTSTWITAITS